jgi:RNA polymerase sigma factor (sigma-70 family)
VSLTRTDSLTAPVLPFSSSKPEDSPLRDLTAGLACGSDVAWQKFHREFGPAIFRQLLAATRGDHDLASEALQQSYLRIARHARPCDSPLEFSAWLRVVARTALSDCRRRRMSFWQLLNRRRDDPSDTDSTNAAEDERLQNALDAALVQLEPAERQLLEAKYFSGTDVRSLAEKLAISPKAAESRLTRARVALRRHVLAALARHE